MRSQIEHSAVGRDTFAAEIESLRLTASRLGESFDRAVAIILTLRGKVVVTGLGKSGLIGAKISATLASTGTPAMFMNAAEALHGDLGFVSEGDTVLMLSNSGSTVELVKMLPALEKIGVEIIGILGKANSPLGRHCSAVLDASVEKEACPLNLAPMSSTTVALVIGDALAAALMKARDFQPNDFALRHPGGALGVRLLLRVDDLMHHGNDLPAIRPGASFREVIAASTRPNLGAACVVDEAGALVGIITDGDVRRALLQYGDLSARADQLMTADPVAIESGRSINDALELMEMREIYVLPVVAGTSRRLVGLLRMHDILSDFAGGESGQ